MAQVEVVVPAHNEERSLETSVSTLRSYLDQNVSFTATITIAVNASTDATWEIARSLSKTLPGVDAVLLERKGRGRALRSVWMASRSPVVAYMDADLSASLDAFVPLIAPLLAGECDVAIGTRLSDAASVVRGRKRELISRTYNRLLRRVFENRFSDAQCGFKAIRSDVARQLLPKVSDDNWFFDTELLLVAEHEGFRVSEVPVDWVDDEDSKVKIVRTALEDLRGIARLRRDFNGPGRVARVLSGRAEDPLWVRPSLAALLALTAVAYVWDLSASGWANSFYAAAVQAATKNFKAMLYGSFDASNFITVDKTPGALWPMDIAARIFGLNSWSLLVPNAIEGVVTVLFVYLTVRRWFGPAAGLIGGAICATTPVAALMFRYDNPDAMLVMVLTIAAYATTRAIEDGRTRWVVLAGAMVGYGFLAKELQALLVIPGISLGYLVGSRGPVLKRVARLFIGAAAAVVTAGWWVALVVLVPASSRPYIGGSQNNSFFNVLFGYNGFGRLSGNETGSVGGGPAGSAWGPTGLLRLFGSEMGTQASWLIPAALIGLVGGLAVVAVQWSSHRKATADGSSSGPVTGLPLAPVGRGTNRQHAAALFMWGGILIVTGLVFSLSKGIIHPYYTVALAPAIGALVAMGGWLLWGERSHVAARVTLAILLGVSTWWSFELLRRSPLWLPWLQWTVLAAGLAAVLLLLGPAMNWSRAAVSLTAVVSLLALVAGPLAETLDTVNTPHTGAIPTAGPAAATSAFGPGSFGRRAFAFGGANSAGNRPFGGFGGRTGGGAPSGFSGQLPGGAPGSPGAVNGGGSGAFGGPPGGFSGSPGSFRRGGGFGTSSGGGAAGGLLNASTPDAAITAALESGANRYTWVAATVGANEAAGYQLASGDPIMAIGGFNGTDPAPTLAQFEKYVREGKIHYFIAGGGFGGLGGLRGFGGFGGFGVPSANGSGRPANPVRFGGSSGGARGLAGESSTSSAITSWVESHFTAKTIGGVTVYDLAPS